MAALLFSDIEGSTRLLQELGPTYADVLVTHRRLLRDEFIRHRGNVEGTEGDSFFVTFPTATDAVQAAAAGQLALAAHDWPPGAAVRVRMGLHIGAIQPVADAIVGMAVHEAARICDAAHGGQVLASDEVARQTASLADVGWTVLGEHRLKDLPAPMRLHQLTHPKLSAQFPPPRSAGGARTNLPSQPTTFVGRGEEIAQIRELVLSGPLVTITGTGGVGKSRIATRVAAELLTSFAAGVWLVDLAAVADPAAVTAAVAASLGIQASDVAELVGSIDQQRMLLLIDNCEHLIASTCEVISEIVLRCPNASVLATSREPLGLPGEVVWRVPPLTPEDAIELLTVRAQAVNQSFAVTSANRPAVDAVCQRLDAIPLALELAAARLTTLSVEQLEARLDQRFRLLSGGVRGVLERHRTLQATVDWSYNLLSPEEQGVLRRCGAFAGSFPLRAVEATTDHLDPIDVLDLVDRLVRKSLVVVEAGGAEPRYRLLETVRQYAVDQLLRGEELVTARDAHLRWVDGVMTAAARTLWLGGEETAWLAQLDTEDGNLHAALSWALERGQVATAATIVFGAVGWFISRGRTAEGLQLAQQVLAAEPEGVGAALLAVSEMSLASGCGRLTDDMVERVRRTADRLSGTEYEWVRPLALTHAAAWSYPPGDVAGAEHAITLCEGYVEQSRPFGPGALGWALQTLFWANLDAGRTDDARVAAEQALAAAVEARLSILESRMAVNRSRVALVQGDYDAAWEYAEYAVRIARGSGETFVVAAATQLLADVAIARHDTALARDLLASIVDAVAESMTPADVDAVVARMTELVEREDDVR
jgi:predicted ATPase/class 3 adenylate cyclase